MEEFYLYLSSEDSLNHFPANTGADFTIQLPRTYYVAGNWLCALKEIQFVNTFDRYFGLNERPTRLYIVTNLCTSSYVNNSEQCVLRAVHVNENQDSICTHNYADAYYLKVIVSEFNALHISITDQTFNKVDFSGGPVYCILHFKKWL